jgi:hypothetical protein
VDYKFVVIREAGWAAFIAVALVVLQALVGIQPELIEDWKTWAIALGGAGLRAGAAALIAAFTKGFAVTEPSVSNPQG